MSGLRVALTWDCHLELVVVHDCVVGRTQVSGMEKKSF